MMEPKDWTEADGLTLEPNARQAVTLMDASAVVVAGPGAGKTELLAQRADFLLRTGACRYPSRILAIAFKADAARTLAARVRKRSGFDRAGRLDSMTFHGFARRLIELFRPLLTGKAALDTGFRVGEQRIGKTQVAFKELLPLALRILEAEPMATRAIRMTYSHVFLDEFQDCTEEQYQLIRVLFAGTSIRVTAVGDTKQRIMAWAGALEGVFDQFRNDFSATPLTLFQNYRSKMRLRRIQNAMVAKMEPAAALDAALLKGDDGVAEVLELPDDDAEADAIAARVEQWVGEGVPAHEIAILVPREPAFYCAPVVAALAERHIPVRNEQALQDLASEPVAQLVVQFLRSIAAKPAPDAYADLMYTVGQWTDDQAKDGNWVRFIEQERRRFQAAKAAQRPAAMRNAAEAFLDRAGPANVLSLASDYADAGAVATLVASVCDHLEAFLVDTGDLALALARFAAEGTVRIMTIHKCKGMEFQAVVLPATESQTWWANRGEERNAFFVGVSRAKDHLLVTHANHRERPAGYPRKWAVARTADAEFVGYLAAEAGGMTE